MNIRDHSKPSGESSLNAATASGEAIFHDETAARAYLESLRWPEGPRCPHCGGRDVRRLGGRAGEEGLLYCPRCPSRHRPKFDVRTGTVFEGSRIPLHKWLQAARHMCSTRACAHARHLEGLLGISNKPALSVWRRLSDLLAGATGIGFDQAEDSEKAQRERMGRVLRGAFPEFAGAGSDKPRARPTALRRRYPNLSTHFLKGTPEGQLSAAYRDRELRPAKVRDYRRALADGALKLPDALNREQRIKLMYMGVEYPEDMPWKVDKRRRPAG